MKKLAALALALIVLTAGVAVAEIIPITLSDDGITCDAPGLLVSGSTITITLPGEYVLYGSLSDGQVIIDSEIEDKIRLHLNNASIHCETGPAIYVLRCKPRFSLVLDDYTVNTLTGGAIFKTESDGEPDGVIYSKDDLTITGAGALKIEAGFKDGIVSKDDLRVKGGDITIEAVRNGIRGRDSVEIYEGNIKITCGNDGLKSTNDEDDGRGFVLIEGGSVSVKCGDDPISAITAVTITGGTFGAVINEDY